MRTADSFFGILCLGLIAFSIMDFLTSISFLYVLENPENLLACYNQATHSLTLFVVSYLGFRFSFREGQADEKL